MIFMRAREKKGKRQKREKNGTPLRANVRPSCYRATRSESRLRSFPLPGIPLEIGDNDENRAEIDG